MRPVSTLISPDIENREQFAAALEAAAANLGFERFSATLRIAGSEGKTLAMTAVDNLPEQLLHEMGTLGPGRTKRDPCTQHFERSRVPLLTNLDLYAEAGAADIWDLMAPYGYRVGVNAAVNLFPRVQFTVSFDTSCALSNGLARTYLGFVQQLANEASEVAQRIFLPKLRNEALGGTDLTAKETEVLRWVMEGKSSTQVGEILGVSENTVNFHLKNAADKLGTSNRVAAVAKALRLGFLT
ncbi:MULTISPECIES: LuxR C-terminal-related transcriptional regulator [Ramlibacter]|uniref:Autoinducer binding domain-containing protein n=1 Tax=Ramlibacter aquaticus TaxID=2780094 RepID=A0ABR9SIB3_9BURK|nr:MULTISPECIES: LuxR C-terminal-related transcriptional regulator [Ramlibacter]MBE7942020.1 autoinducer binding domain-containing protein [Ramlibacter aquaticus]